MIATGVALFCKISNLLNDEPGEKVHSWAIQLLLGAARAPMLSNLALPPQRVPQSPVKEGPRNLQLRPLLAKAS